jgi:hypothetical protein
MRQKAIDLGEEIVAREAVLDELFDTGTVSGASLSEATEAIGRLNGQLRAHHLSYHLAMRDLLDPRQIRHYQLLRGYASSAGSGEHGQGHAGHGGQ